MSDYYALTPADFETFWALDSYAFRAQYRRDRYTPEVIGQLRGLRVGGEHVAQIQIIPMEVEGGAGPLPAAGIGSVATAPEHRRRGHTATLLRHACDELIGRGVSLALLHPFSRSFYGRYGWATSIERRLYRGAPALFRPFRPGPGRFHRVGPEAIAELDGIYRGALRGRFGPNVRSEAWWRSDVLQTWAGEPYHTYIWRDEAGRGRSYLVFRLVQAAGPSGWNIDCREMVALDPLARGQLFAFLADHDSQADEVIFRAPADAPVNSLFPDPLACEIDHHFMLRLVDVGRALASMAYPRGVSGRLTLAVSDGWIASNNRAFSLELADGRAGVEALPEGAPAQLRCDVGVLAQIYARYLRPRTAAAFGLLEADDRGALGLLEQAFAGLAPFNSDYY